MQCLRQGAAALGGWRLLGTTLYVTLEPCPMCAGALLQVRCAAGLALFCCTTPCVFHFPEPCVPGRCLRCMARQGAALAVSVSCAHIAPTYAAAETSLVLLGPLCCRCLSKESSQYPWTSAPALQARVAGVVYGARNHLLGADGSWIAMLPGQGSSEGDEAPSSAQHAQREPAREPSGQHDERCSCSNCRSPSSLEAGASGRGSGFALGVPVPEAGGGSTAGVAGPAGEAASPRHPFHPELQVVRGVLAEECSALMRRFFRERRLLGSGSGYSSSRGSSGDEG